MVRTLCSPRNEARFLEFDARYESSCIREDIYLRIAGWLTVSDIYHRCTKKGVLMLHRSFHGFVSAAGFLSSPR